MRPSYRPDIPPKPPLYRTQVLDHLGLVAGMFDELGIGDVLDQATHQNPEMRTSRWVKPSKRWCSMAWGLSTKRSTSCRASSRISRPPA